MKKWIAILTMLFLLGETICPYGGETESEQIDAIETDAGQIQTSVSQIDQFGNLVLDIRASDAEAVGFNVGDIAAVELNGTSYDMPVATNYTDVDAGSFLCRLVIKPEEQTDCVVLAINMGSLAEWADLATHEETDEDPGYLWTLNNGVPDPIPVVLTMKEKGGYNDQLQLHQLVRSDKREDYPDLDDAAYANFREITTTGMGRHALYRSSSPVNPEINRNHEADAASEKAGIRTFINMADSEDAMYAYEGFDDSYYSKQNIICLNMVLDFQSEEFDQKLAKGLTYITQQDGPFLIHCTEGKDRAGFAAAILEAFMGAEFDEIVQDYMTTYYNYYGIEPGSELYEKIAESNIENSQAAALELDSFEGADLKQAATKYLERIGLSDETIEKLREKLSKEY